MYKVYIDKISTNMGNNNSSVINIENEHDLYELCRNFKRTTDSDHFPVLVQLIKVDEFGANLRRAYICYNERQIGQFVKRTVEQDAISIGMYHLFEE